MKAARYIINGQFMNQMIFRILDRRSRCGSKQISGNVQYSKPLLIICGLIELMFWAFVLIVFGGTVLLSLVGLLMLIFT